MRIKSTRLAYVLIQIKQKEFLHPLEVVDYVQQKKN